MKPDGLAAVTNLAKARPGGGQSESVRDAIEPLLPRLWRFCHVFNGGQHNGGRFSPIDVSTCFGAR
jgi:hypothetical protein